jgi:hypothetical protein
MDLRRKYQLEFVVSPSMEEDRSWSPGIESNVTGGITVETIFVYLVSMAINILKPVFPESLGGRNRGSRAVREQQLVAVKI